MQIVCFCHLRWNFVYQRPQHLLTRFAQRGQVHFWEEPVFQSCDGPSLAVTVSESNINILTPVLPHGLQEDEIVATQRELLDKYLASRNLDNFVAWYYTPVALQFTDHLSPSVTVYDCMDELSAFDGAPPILQQEEKRLFNRADVIFVGGASLYAAKRTQHENAQLFPSSIDHAHFATARTHPKEPSDQAAIPHPRIGFYGVLDERLDRDLLRDVAVMRPDWHLVLIGPVVKINEDDLPKAQNLHYLGQRNYSDLPSYLGGWDVAMLPFARNASTRFISPTKTPEYLAGGKPVVSTPIQDVIHPYETEALVRIGTTPQEFVEAIEESLQQSSKAWLIRVDTFLSQNSWDKTFEGMWQAIQLCEVRNSHRLADPQDTRKEMGAHV